MLLLCLGLISPALFAASDLPVVRRNLVDYYTGAGADRTSRRVADSLASLESSVRAATDPSILRSDGSWSDIDYAEVPSGVWSPWEHFRRIMIMARGLETQGQVFYRAAALRSLLEASLAYLQTFYGPKVSTPGNWWFWTIGPALDLGPALVLVAGDIDPAVLASARDVLAARIGPAPGYTNSFSSLEGQNLVWSSLNHLMLAILDDSAARAGLVRDRMSQVTIPVAGQEGIQPDFSFHQHGAQLYTGGYGGSFANDVSRYYLVTRGTSLAVPAANSAFFADFVADGIAWGLYHNYFDVSVVGREVSRPSTSGYNGLAALLQMSAVDSARQPEIRRAASMMLRSWTWSLPVELSGLTDLSSEASWPSGHRHYGDSDYTAHRRAGWFASVRMFSSRTKSGESTNDENLLGSRAADGRFYLVIGGDEYYRTAVPPTLDWSRLPGTTVEQKVDAASATFGYGTRSFVGGTGDGRNGVSAMDYAPLASALTARKAWMFFDDVILFLTSGISCVSGNPVETIVDQRPLEGTLLIDNSAFSGGERSTRASWMHAGYVGYLFPSRDQVTVREEMRSGSWAEINATGSPASVMSEMRTISIPHGSSITNGSAEYFVLPGASPQRTASFAATPPVRILQNDALAAVARDDRGGAMGIVFWAAGSAGGMSSSRPAVVFRTTAGRRTTISVADPAQSGSRVRLIVPGAWKLVSGSAPATLTRASHSAMLEVSTLRGNTTTIVLEDISRRRAVRR